MSKGTIPQQIANELKQYKDSNDLQKLVILMHCIHQLEHSKDTPLEIKTKADAIRLIEGLAYPALKLRYTQRNDLEAKNPFGASEEDTLIDRLEDVMQEKDENPNPETFDLTILQALLQKNKVKYADLIWIFKKDLEGFTTGHLTSTDYWLVAEYAVSKELVQNELKATVQSYVKTLNHDSLWEQAYIELEKATKGCTELQQKFLKNSVEQLKTSLNNPFMPDVEKKAAYEFFTLQCKTILKDSPSSLLYTVYQIGAALLLTLVAASLGFLIGFFAGLATGPGAVFSGIIAGSAAVGAVVATGGLAYASSGWMGQFFRPKELDAVEAYLGNVQAIEESFGLK